MLYKDICTRKEYEVNGVKKTTWLKCGTFRVTDSGKEFIELNHLPNVSFYVFSKKEQSAPPSQNPQTTEEAWLNEDAQ